MSSWDRMVIPVPFTRAIFLYGEPISIDRREDVQQARMRIEDALNQLAENAEQRFEELWTKDEGGRMKDE